MYTDIFCSVVQSYAVVLAGFGFMRWRKNKISKGDEWGSPQAGSNQNSVFYLF
jgi:hypothetical protein